MHFHQRGPDAGLEGLEGTEFPMKSLIHFLSQPFTKLGVDATTALQATRDPKFGDYQCSAPLAAAKREGKPPRQLAQEWLDTLKDDFSGVASLELAGPGFINLKLEDAFLALVAEPTNRGVAA